MRKSLCFMLSILVFTCLVGGTAVASDYAIFSVTGKRLSDNSSVSGHLEVYTDKDEKNCVVVGVITDKEGRLDIVTGNHIENGTYRLSGRRDTYEVNKKE